MPLLTGHIETPCPCTVLETMPDGHLLVQCTAPGHVCEPFTVPIWRVMDTTQRYVPETFRHLNGRALPVQNVTFFPPGKHPATCPIRGDWHAVRAMLRVTPTHLAPRWFGFLGGGINSELRAVVWGIPYADTVRMQWTPVPPDLQIPEMY